MVWVKICGITNLADAEAAVKYGAAAVGFVFTSSKRKIAPETARKIIRALPRNVEKIGVFAGAEIAKVREIAAYCGLTGIQFQGEESPEYLSSFRNYELIKAFRVDSRVDWRRIGAYAANNIVQRILFDTYVSGQPGGTGKTFKWEIVSGLRWPRVAVIIAGGLNPDNVAQAIWAAGKPDGVDVSSGVEKEAGQKDLIKLQTFLKRARGL